MKNRYYVGASVLVLISIVMSMFYAYTMTKRPMTGLESALWQIFVFSAGLVGSFIFGKQSAQKAAREMLKPHARSAFRRLISLYQSLQRVAAAIQSSRRPQSYENYRMTVAKLEVIVIEQLAAADDALADWNDIVPEDVAELKQKLRSDNRTREEQ